MPLINPRLHEAYGIDEIYFHPHLDSSLLKKLELRAQFTIDRLGPADIILIYYKKSPDPFSIKRFIKLVQNDREYIESNTLLNEEELFEAIKSKNYVLITSRDLSSF